MFWRQWARKDLMAGDLSALLDLSRGGRWDNLNPNRLRRLRRRGFIYGDDAALQRDNYDGRLPTIKLAKSGSRRVARRELPV
jgi:hypothetical protein